MFSFLIVLKLDDYGQHPDLDVRLFGLHPIPQSPNGPGYHGGQSGLPTSSPAIRGLGIVDLFYNHPHLQWI
jgi:hypothetical protein